jgi:hypothetical protein
MANVDNYQDILDSRDIIDRIEELEADEESLEPGEKDELGALRKLAGEAGSSPDWGYGETLIRGSYFRDYAQKIAEDCGMIKSDCSWPYTCIDWDQAANELKMDYFRVDFGGVDYWIHA